MRRTFDDLWIIDLGGDNLGTRKTPNVFNIQTPVAIAIGVRASKPSPNTPAKVRYAKVEGSTREDKLGCLGAVTAFSGIAWRDCPSDWHKPFLPIGNGDFFSWPELVNLFPWRQTGSQFQRTWPIAETEAVLECRWRKLLAETDPIKQDRLFKEAYA
jgi:hypothetical protein